MSPHTSRHSQLGPPGKKDDDDGDDCWTYAFAIRIVKRLEIHNVGMMDDPHDLKLAVLRTQRQRGRVLVEEHFTSLHLTYLETLVLEDALDGSIFAAGRQLGLENDSERAIADDLALSVLDIAGLAGQAILDLFADDLYKARGKSVTCRSIKTTTAKANTEKLLTYHPCVSCRTCRTCSVVTWRDTGWSHHHNNNTNSSSTTDDD